MNGVSSILPDHSVDFNTISVNETYPKLVRMYCVFFLLSKAEYFEVTLEQQVEQTVNILEDEVKTKARH
jgi:hypothetical protein